jgi:hypothetical protein
VKRKILLELFESHEKTNFYTLRFKDETRTEFDKFYDEFDTPENSDDLDIIINWIDIIGKKGALERNFRPERGKLKALPAETNRLRLFCFKVTEGIVILGNGGRKTTKTFNEDPKLNLYANTVDTIGKFLLSRLKNGSVVEYNNVLYKNLEFNLDLTDEK